MFSRVPRENAAGASKNDGEPCPCGAPHKWQLGANELSRGPAGHPNPGRFVLTTPPCPLCQSQGPPTGVFGHPPPCMQGTRFSRGGIESRGGPQRCPRHRTVLRSPKGGMCPSFELKKVPHVTNIQNQQNRCLGVGFRGPREVPCYFTCEKHPANKWDHDPPFL